MVAPLISAADLHEMVERGLPLTLLDVRWALQGGPGVEDYRLGHIPGASFVDLDRELAGPPGAGRHPLPAAADFQVAMRRHGVSEGTPVVVYDAADGTAASRAWWTLRYFGHPDVRLLDGGFRAWQEAGFRPDSAQPVAPAGDFTARPGHMPLLDAAGAAALAARGVLLDARAPERFRGEVEPVDPVAGHIPGARNLPALGNVRPDGRLREIAELRARFAAAGARPGADVGVYCGSGVTAAEEVLALAAIGTNAALYVGSWSDWITDPARPVEREADGDQAG